MKQRIVIGGCRQYNNYSDFSKCILSDFMSCEINEIVIVSGGCSGVDNMAQRYAKEHDLECVVYPADWKRYGKAAGPIRNRWMVENSDAVIAFWDGKSKGTKSLIDLAIKQGKFLKIHEIHIE